jgi:hypothetical protein
VAADGVHSKIGSEYCKDQKVNTGNITIYGRTFFTDEAKKQIAPVLQKGTSVIMGNQFSLITDAMEFDLSRKNGLWNVLTPMENYFYWAFIGNPEAFGLYQADFYSQSPEEVFRCINALTDQWHPKLRALFEYADQQSLSVTPIRSSLVKKQWESGSITALGDAVHTMSPAGGVGANTAFMDAALLAKNINEALVNNTSIIKAVADYEEKMRIYSSQAVEMSLRGGEILHRTNEKNE